jgi:hypothetical protein
MEASTSTAVLDMDVQDLGIVILKQAMEDQAPGAQETAKDAGILKGSKAANSKYWCTECSMLLGRKAAYNHRAMHAREVHQELKTNADALLDLEGRLDAKYGA